MKKVMFLFLVSASISLGASAQATPSKAEAKAAVRNDVKELKEERNDRNTKIAHGKFKQAKEVQKDINADRKDLKANKKHLKNKGVKNPVEKAKEGKL